jgi:molybdenum cofactor cytidylyltransferase
MNCIDPMISIATMPDLRRVTAGVMLATIKIVAYGVPNDQLDQGCDAVAAKTAGTADRFALGTHTARLTTAILIETHHPGHSPQPKGRRVLDERVDRLGCTLIQVICYSWAIVTRALSLAFRAVRARLRSMGRIGCWNV